MGLRITKLWARHDFAAKSCCDLDLQGSEPILARDTLSQYGDHFCERVLKLTSNNKRHVFAARSCCDLDLEGSDPNVACDTSP